jgi:hypothetical protein
MFEREFWKDAGERCIKTAAQFGLGAWGATTFTDVGEVVSTGQAVGLAVLFGAGFSLLTSLASTAIGDKGSASMVKLQKTPDNGVVPITPPTTKETPDA